MHSSRLSAFQLAMHNSKCLETWSVTCLVRCSERVKPIYPHNVYQLRGTLFDKLDSFDIQYTND